MVQHCITARCRHLRSSPIRKVALVLADLKALHPTGVRPILGVRAAEQIDQKSYNAVSL